MSFIALESEVVGTHYDPKTRICSYTILRDGKRWTAHVPLEALEKHKGNKKLRRDFIANALVAAMRGPADK